MTDLQPIGNLRRYPARRGMGLDIFDHLHLSLREICDQLAGLNGRCVEVAGRPDQPAALFRALAQRGELIRALLGQSRKRRWKCPLRVSNAGPEQKEYLYARNRERYKAMRADGSYDDQRRQR